MRTFQRVIKYPKNGEMRKIQTTVVFEDLINTDKRICVFQGASRASKSYNILIYWVYRLLQEENKVLSIVRKTLPSLKGSILRDLKEILIKFEVYDSSKWNSTDGYFMLGSNIIEWFSLADEERIRGRKRDYLFINEGTEISDEEYIQLSLRTSDRITIDLNPSLWNCWIYDLEGQDDVFYKIITYKSNPFLSEVQIKEIEKLKDKDPNLWKVFGLGQRGTPTRVVFSHQQICDEVPREAKLLGYGVDYGWEDPNTLIAVYKLNDNIYCDELLYLRHVTLPDFIYKIKDLDLNYRDNFICDSSAPQNIEEMRRNGINAKPVKKGTILHGIDLMKRNNLHITSTSLNLIEEMRMYVWKQDKNGKNLDEPVDDYNHGIDSVRYVLESTITKPKGKITIL
jgi:phage terminase large subunit